MLKMHFLHIYFNKLYNYTKVNKNVIRNLKNEFREKFEMDHTLVGRTNRDVLLVCSSQWFTSQRGLHCDILPQNPKPKQEK